MKKVISILLFGFLAIGVAFSCKKQSNSQQEEVNFKELSKQPNTVIIDVRTTEEYGAGHLQQSINIPLQILPDSVESLKKFENIILICRSGNRSGKAKMLLEEKGFKNVYNGGGWETFQKEIK